MSVTHPKGPTQRATDLSIQPIFEIEGNRIPRHEIPAAERSRPTWPTRSSTTS